MYHRRERTTEDGTTEDGTTEDSHVDFLNLIVDDVLIQRRGICGKCLRLSFERNVDANVEAIECFI